MRPLWRFPRGQGRLAAEETRLFLPGWGFTGRVLLLAEQPLPWVFPEFVLDADSLAGELLSFLDRQGAERVHLAGWSLGAHLALDFALAHPGRVASLTLMAMRASWPQAEVEAIGLALEQGQEEFLRDFYRKCFLGYKKEYHRFVTEEQEALLGQVDLPLLQRGLGYLHAWQRPQLLPDCPVRCWHGRRDLIAPLAKQAQLAGAELRVLEHGGHAVFLDRELSGLD